MKVDAIKKSSKIQGAIRVFVLITIISVFLSSNLLAKTAKEIDASVDVAIDRFYKQVKGASEFVKASKGMLVMPNVKKGAFIIGGQFGEGALRVGGKSVDYYNTVSGSIGFQIGGQSQDIILLFMTDEALKQFKMINGVNGLIDSTFIKTYKNRVKKWKEVGDDGYPMDDDEIYKMYGTKNVSRLENIDTISTMINKWIKK